MSAHVVEVRAKTDRRYARFLGIVFLIIFNSSLLNSFETYYSIIWRYRILNMIIILIYLKILLYLIIIYIWYYQVRLIIISFMIIIRYLYTFDRTKTLMYHILTGESGLYRRFPSIPHSFPGLSPIYFLQYTSRRYMIFRYFDDIIK